MKTIELARKIYEYTPPWDRENTVEEIANIIDTDPGAIISYLVDIIEDLSA